ncbi:preprotein translocase subunit YajC [Chitinophaga sedimenti]|uniref:preprotein translocase subunit YajC n=1 Tax=Chitinophaga sedimenti TaxID=2033606 RepID=UPI002006A511|nr:preprotein translocase subunit YajC [Chitinophaga sedimenti]MCK7553841.1 preprotein translocase subunit YajC [Chitinophaga sedimenti]
MYSNLLNLLMAPPAAGQSGGMGAYGNFIFIGGMLVVMYFFMIRPQTKKAKEQKQFSEGLKEGDKIVTIAGMHGKIKKINADGTIVVEIAVGTSVTMERSAISREYSAAIQKAEAK